MAPADRPPGQDIGGGPDAADPEATIHLLTAARAGDQEALDRLFARYLPELRRWASGRLPDWARDISDTHDLVQETVFQVFKKLEGFEYRGEGALRAYLRQAFMNRMRNEIRRARRRPAEEAIDSGVEDPGASPIERAIGEQAAEQYEMALSRLKPEERELIIARVELGLSYQEMVTMLGKPSPDAARMAVARALVRLTEEMGREST
jgi:RNA polymerase sigma-70 factor (ECF subfamily)